MRELNYGIKTGMKNLQQLQENLIKGENCRIECG
jgi:hypothetical protein